MRLKVRTNLRTASPNSKFTGCYKKKCSTAIELNSNNLLVFNMKKLKSENLKVKKIWSLSQKIDF